MLTKYRLSLTPPSLHLCFFEVGSTVWPQFLLAAPLEKPQASCPNLVCFSLQLWGRSFWMTYQLLNSIFCSLSGQAGTFRLPGLLYFGIFWFGRSFFTICFQLSISLTDNVSCFLSLSFEALISVSFLPFVGNLPWVRPYTRQWGYDSEWQSLFLRGGHSYYIA